MSDSELEQLINAWLDGRISDAQSEALQERLRNSKVARQRFLALSALDASIRQVAEGESDPVRSDVVPVRASDSTESFFSVSNLMKLAIAALLILLVGVKAYQIGKKDAQTDNVASNQSDAEATIAGYATLRRVAGIKWSDNVAAFREGDVLPSGVLQFEKGVAEIDFFCGATVIVEGPAQLELESDWSLRLLKGRLRANVPPAAQGFAVKVADSEVIDLGTEFALDVSEDSAWVQVVDGEVRLKGGEHDGKHLFAGEGEAIVGVRTGGESLQSLSTDGEFERRHREEQQARFANWKAEIGKLKNDDRLIAFYPIGLHEDDRFLKNAGAAGTKFDGKLVGSVEFGEGRFGASSTGFGFSRPGSRVRVRLDGQYEKFTLAGWVRIDSLEHKYNAIFMSDGYENGEPHWQIRDDGRMMFSVMVDDTPGSGHGDHPDARLHRIYYTEPVWDVSRGGQWMHLAATYDPENRVVQQYVNGEQVSKEEISEEFFVDQLRIGPAEIGNWGQPFRESSWFRVRNLNGAIDEMAIFDAALSAEEIKSLYDNGKPFGN